MNVAVFSEWCSIAGFVVGAAGLIAALWAWRSSNRTAERAQRSLNAVADGLEALSRGLTVRFSRDAEGNIIAQVVTGKLNLVSGPASWSLTGGATPPAPAPPAHKRPWWVIWR